MSSHICNEHYSLVYNHFGQSYMSEFTTAYDIRITRIWSYFSQTCEEYDHGSI